MTLPFRLLNHVFSITEIKIGINKYPGEGRQILIYERGTNLKIKTLCKKNHCGCIFLGGRIISNNQFFIRQEEKNTMKVWSWKTSLCICCEAEFLIMFYRRNAATALVQNRNSPRVTASSWKFGEL